MTPKEYKAMHEENLLSSWLKQDVRGQEERTAKVSEKSDEERGEKRKREEEKEENETSRVQRRSNGLFSVEGFEILSREEDLESCGGLSWEYLVEKLEDLFDFEPDTLALVRVVPDVIDELVSLSSMVTEFCEVLSCCFDWEDVVPQSFSFSQKRSQCCTCTQEEMRYGSPQMKALPLSRRRKMPLTPVQNSNDTFEEEQGACCGGRSDVECKRKNRNGTVLGKKTCWVRSTRREEAAIFSSSLTNQRNRTTAGESGEK